MIDTIDKDSPIACSATCDIPEEAPKTLAELKREKREQKFARRELKHPFASKRIVALSFSSICSLILLILFISLLVILQKQSGTTQDSGEIFGKAIANVFLLMEIIIAGIASIIISAVSSISAMFSVKKPIRITAYCLLSFDVILLIACAFVLFI